MKPWRLIISGPDDGPGNMATDEAMLVSLSEGAFDRPTFRIYTWRQPWITIGYFQKYAEFAGRGMPLTRRLTGGLLVEHGRDISYGFTASKADWPHLYCQEKTYERIHAGMRQGLRLLGMKSEFSPVGRGDEKSGVCVARVYPYDLEMQGGKVLGSCQRRRGSALLQQGALHIQFKESYQEVAASIASGLEMELGIRFDAGEMTKEEAPLARKLMDEKYGVDEWNRKF